MFQLFGLGPLLLALALPVNSITNSRVRTQQPKSKCPSLGIVAPDGKEMRDDIWRFTALLEGGEPNTKVSFMWTVYKTKIVSGQSTKSITIEKPDLERGITVVVEVGGFAADCATKATVTMIS